MKCLDQAKVGQTQKVILDAFSIISPYHPFFFYFSFFLFLIKLWFYFNNQTERQMNEHCVECKAIYNKRKLRACLDVERTAHPPFLLIQKQTLGFHWWKKWNPPMRKWGRWVFHPIQMRLLAKACAETDFSIIKRERERTEFSIRKMDAK